MSYLKRTKRLNVDESRAIARDVMETHFDYSQFPTLLWQNKLTSTKCSKKEYVIKFCIPSKNEVNGIDDVRPEWHPDNLYRPVFSVTVDRWTGETTHEVIPVDFFDKG